LFLPIGDSPNPPGKPWVTYALIAANVLVYLALLPLSYRAPSPDNPEFAQYLRVVAAERRLELPQLRSLAAQVSDYDLLVFRHGFKPAAPSLSDVLASMFLHGSLMHLLGNMLFLWIYGDNVEHRLGRLGFLAAYLGTGVAACAGDGLLRLGSSIPSVGASGAISGVLGMYFLWFPRNRVRVWVFFFPFYVDLLELPSRIVIGFFLVVDNLLPLVLTAGEGGVSYGAHFGGFAAGVGAAALVNRAVLRPEGRLREDPQTKPRPSADSVAGFRDALDSGHWDAAAEWFFHAPHPVTRGDVTAREKTTLGQELERNGHPRAALAAYQRALADHPRDRARVAAHLGAARVLLRSLGSPTAAYQHVQSALEESSSPEERAEARAVLLELSQRVRSVPRAR